MTDHFLDQPGELFLGSSIHSAREQGSRRFRTVRKALRFAMEHAAPVSLRGAMLRCGDRSYGPDAIRALHAELLTASA